MVNNGHPQYYKVINNDIFASYNGIDWFWFDCIE